MDAFLLKLKNDCKTVKVTATEIANIYYIVIVQDSQSYRSADCGSKLAPLIFPDLEIAKKKKCHVVLKTVINMLAPASVVNSLTDLKTPMVQLHSDKNTHMPFVSMASDASYHENRTFLRLPIQLSVRPELGFKRSVKLNCDWISFLSIFCR